MTDFTGMNATERFNELLGAIFNKDSAIYADGGDKHNWAMNMLDWASWNIVNGGAAQFGENTVGWANMSANQKALVILRQNNAALKDHRDAGRAQKARQEAIDALTPISDE